MKSLKKSKSITFFITLFLLLTACSSDSSESTDNEDKDSENHEKVTIVYAAGKDPTGSPQKQIKVFEKKHPNINVEYREMPTDTGVQHNSYITSLNAGSSEIDVFEMDVIWPAEFAQADYVMPLDRFIKKDGIDLDDYNQGPISAATFNGKLWAMPKFIDAGMLFYRKDIVEDVPKTWDDLIAQAKELDGQKGTKFGYLMQAKQYEGLVCNAVEFIAAYGGQIINKNGEVVINSEDSIQGLKKLVEIANSDFVPENITTFTEPESHTAFIEGQSPFIRNWPYQYALANDPEQSEIVDKVQVAPLPKGDEGSAAALGGWLAAINKNTEHPKEAWEFLKFMTGPEGQKIDAVIGGHAPTIKSLYKDEEVIEANPFFGEEGFQKALDAAVSRPVAPNYAEISEIIQIQVSKAIAGEISVEKAVQNMQTKMEATIQD